MINDDSIAVYLMHFGHKYNIALSPQSILKLLKQLYESGLTPSKLFSVQDDALFRAAELSLIESDGLKNMSQGYIPAKMEIKRLLNKGIKVLSMVDSDYPTKLKSRLKFRTPPILFYSGDISMLEEKSIAIVGQRDATPNDLRIADRLAVLGAGENAIIVSGGAGGVDFAAQSSALSNNGRVAVFYPQCISARVNDINISKWVENGRILLLSHAIPFSPFSATNALTRNRYIHASGDFSIAVSSKLRKGGTWSGACDNIKNGFTPMFVCDLPNAGNNELIRMGAIALESNLLWNNGFKLYDYLGATLQR